MPCDSFNYGNIAYSLTPYHLGSIWSQSLPELPRGLAAAVSFNEPTPAAGGGGWAHYSVLRARAPLDGWLVGQ